MNPGGTALSGEPRVQDRPRSVLLALTQVIARVWGAASDLWSGRGRDRRLPTI
jgi:hypothetical protein